VTYSPPGELDWVEWRINRFLGKATDAEIEGLPDEPIAPPKATRIRIEEDHFETRINCPNTAETGSYSGIVSAIFGL